jgi:hypothetical protein
MRDEGKSRNEDVENTKSLLAEHYAQSAAPAFPAAYADDFPVAGKIALQGAGCGMKTQRRRDQNSRSAQNRPGAYAQRMRAQQAAACKGRSRFSVAFNSRNRQAPCARDAEKIQHSVLPGHLCKHLLVDVGGIQGDVDAADVLADRGGTVPFS